MKIRTIECNDDSEIESATVTITAAEIALIARMIGMTSGIQRNEIMAYGSNVGSGIYDALTSLINRFYEDGLDELIQTISQEP